MKIFLSILTALIVVLNTTANALPKGFVYLNDIDPTIIQDIKYDTSDNFVGRLIQGYQAPQCILTYRTALALAKLQHGLKTQLLGLKVYDCYRPQQAVNDFMQWSQDSRDQKMKQEFYPNVNKADLFKLGYIAEKSGHTRGSTVDLTLVQLPSKRVDKPTELDMGTHFDFMDELSYPLNPNFSEEIRHNRTLLRNLMKKGGFVPYDKEWWHFTLKNEPYPNTYFNFPVR